MFLDIAIGIYSAAFLGWLLQFNPSTWFFIGGILITVLPDADFIYFYIKSKSRIDDSKHRDYIHYPLIYLPLGTLIFHFIGGKEWSFLFFLCSFLHFVHDSIAVGWGIKWLWPFSKNNFAFFYLRSGRQKKGLKKIIFSFDKKTLDYYIRKHGDKNWVKNIYYKLHPIAIVEFTVFVSSIIFLVFLYHIK